MIPSINRLIFKEKINGKPVFIGGLEDHKEDVRDFEYADLGGFFDSFYQAKHERLEHDMLSIKNQGSLNTCVWNSYAVSREPHEKVVLSPKSIVQYAVKKGYIRGNGFTTLREGQKAGSEFGIAEESVAPNILTDWNSYAYAPLLQIVKENAAKHKSSKYFSVTSQGEVLKALDDGNIIHTGFDWYSGYNMTDGFKAPWVLSWRKGWKVGGHAVALIGYDKPKGLYIFQNSFGESWGDNGKFYVKMSDYHKSGIVGYVAVDLEGDKLAEFIRSHEGLDVKATKSTIYRVQDGKKRPYLNEITFYAFGGLFEGDWTPDELKNGPTFDPVAADLLDLLPDGGPMDAPESPYWPKLANEWQNIQWMRYPDNVKRIKQLIYGN